MLLYALTFRFLLLHHVFGANPIDIPIIHRGMEAHTRLYAQIPPTGTSVSRIVSMTAMGADLYVVDLTRIYRVKPDGTSSLFMDVAAAFKEATGRGLNIVQPFHGGVRCIAFHPRFEHNQLFYLSAMENRPRRMLQDYHYLSDVPNSIRSDSVLVEFKVNKTTQLPIHSSYRNVFRVGMPVYDHPIKQMAFYKKNLYIAHGDGSEQSAVVGGGQRRDALGKILRIDPRKHGDSPYRVPSSNPFLNSSIMIPEVFAYGFRNPHHICFSKDGHLFVADAGRDNVEEVNLVLKGKNYGWSLREGTFVHLAQGGLLTGVAPLPKNDSRNKFIYPVAQLGHEGRVGDRFIGQAIGGACPIENGSPMSGYYFYTDFPKSGRLFFSSLEELYAARMRGTPSSLTQAPTRQATIFFDHDNDPSTPPREFANLRDVIKDDPHYGREDRADVRFGRGSKGELYWSSKRNGRVYIFTSSLPGGPGGPPFEPTGDGTV